MGKTSLWIKKKSNRCSHVSRSKLPFDCGGHGIKPLLGAQDPCNVRPTGANLALPGAAGSSVPGDRGGTFLAQGLGSVPGISCTLCRTGIKSDFLVEHPHPVIKIAMP